MTNGWKLVSSLVDIDELLKKNQDEIEEVLYHIKVVTGMEEYDDEVIISTLQAMKDGCFDDEGE